MARRRGRTGPGRPARRSSPSIVACRAAPRRRARGRRAAAGGSSRRTRPMSRTVRSGGRGSRWSAGPRDRSWARRRGAAGRARHRGRFRLGAPAALARSTPAPDGSGGSSEHASTSGTATAPASRSQVRPVASVVKNSRRCAGMGLREHPAPVVEIDVRTRSRRRHRAPARVARPPAPECPLQDRLQRPRPCGPQPRDRRSVDAWSDSGYCSRHGRTHAVRSRRRGLGVPDAQRVLGVQQRRAGRRRRRVAARRHAVRPPADPRHVGLDARRDRDAARSAPSSTPTPTATTATGTSCSATRGSSRRTPRAEEMDDVPPALMHTFKSLDIGEDGNRLVADAFGPFTFDDIEPVAPDRHVHRFDRRSTSAAPRSRSRRSARAHAGRRHRVAAATRASCSPATSSSTARPRSCGPDRSGTGSRRAGGSASSSRPWSCPVTARSPTSKGCAQFERYLEWIDGEATKRHAAGMSAIDAAWDIELGEYADWGDSERTVVTVDSIYAGARPGPQAPERDQRVPGDGPLPRPAD